MSTTTNRTIELRKAIREDIKAIIANTFYAIADDTSSYPYAVFTVEEINTQDGVIRCELEVNCVDYGHDTSTIEQKAADIVTLFDHRFYNGTHVAYVSYFDRKNNVASEDTNSVRRRLVFSLNLYEKE